MARWLVTGGAGFIGSNIVHRLAADGERVRVLDDFSTGKRANLRGLPPARVQVIEGDLRDWRAVLAAVRGCDYVLHQGALGSVPRSLADPVTTTEVNVLGSVNVLEAARRAGCVKRVVLASSSSVYGDTPTLPKTEGMPLLPLSPYAASKAAMEGFARAFSASHGVEAVLLRYFNVFGPRQDPLSTYASVIPKFITAMLDGHPPVVEGDGLQSRDFTFIDNVVHGNMLALHAPKAAGKMMNLATGSRVTLLDLVAKLNRQLGTDIAPIHAPERVGDIKHSRADIELAGALLGYEPVVDFDAGLARTIDWYKTQVQG
ncbi:MAG: SDR family oxidoreductase [Planctomycetaceae bacterium]|nr:SDR family oxidoreductase [Planctomycetaceae bacterium]